MALPPRFGSKISGWRVDSHHHPETRPLMASPPSTLRPSVPPNLRRRSCIDIPPPLPSRRCDLGFDSFLLCLRSSNPYLPSPPSIPRRCRVKPPPPHPLPATMKAKATIQPSAFVLSPPLAIDVMRVGSASSQMVDCPCSPFRGSSSIPPAISSRCSAATAFRRHRLSSSAARRKNK
jgi:hypothetical protein